MGADANCRVGVVDAQGVQRGRRREGERGVIEAAGEVEPDVEDEAGTNFRRSLEDTGLVALNTHWASGPTLWNYLRGRTSRIDYLCVSCDCFGEGVVRNVWVDNRGEKLQLIHVARRADHRPWRCLWTSR